MRCNFGILYIVASGGTTCQGDNPWSKSPFISHVNVLRHYHYSIWGSCLVSPCGWYNMWNLFWWNPVKRSHMTLALLLLLFLSVFIPHITDVSPPSFDTPGLNHGKKIQEETAETHSVSVYTVNKHAQERLRGKKKTAQSPSYFFRPQSKTWRQWDDGGCGYRERTWKRWKQTWFM